jgi:Zn-dependent peptidase ImmA (M78 family)
MTPRAWVEHLVGQIDQETKEALARGPAQALRDYFGLRVVESSTLSKRGDGGWCDGLSFSSHDEVLYAPSPFSKRKNFTILHELGHKLTDEETDEEILDWLGEIKDERQVVEHVCDLVAARLLLPDAMVESALEEERPTGAALARLHRDSHASREACAMALSQRLGCTGFVCVIRDDTVTFTGRLGVPRPAPWRDVSLPTGHPLRHMGHGEIQAIESWWPDYVGKRHRYYQHAFSETPWTYAVFAENDLWSVTNLHLPEEQQRHARGEPVRFSCQNCGLRRWTRTFSCDTCGGRACPKCEYCPACDGKEKLPRSLCQFCTKSVLIHLLDEHGLCPDCR